MVGYLLYVVIFALLTQHITCCWMMSRKVLLNSQSCWESRTDMDCDGLFGRCGQICCVAYMLSTYTTKRKNVTWSGYQLSRTLLPQHTKNSLATNWKGGTVATCKRMSCWMDVCSKFCRQSVRETSSCDYLLQLICGITSKSHEKNTRNPPYIRRHHHCDV